VKIIDRHESDTRGNSTKRVACVFPEERPITKGDIAGDFAWRRTVDLSVHAKAILAKIEPKLRKAGVTGDLTIKWERRAGCSCPCSPGFVVRSSDRQYGTYPLFWVEL
jgi:hypothetical protein